MDFKNLNSKIYLLNLLENENEFLESLKITNGFVLEKMKSFDIYPNKKILIDNINAIYSKFLIENYKLEKNELVLVNEFLSQSAKTKISTKDLSKEEILNLLKNDKEIPQDTILSLEEINKYKVNLINGLNRYDEILEEILEKSIKILTLEDILLIDKTILIKIPNLLNSNKEYFKDDRYANLYKELMISNKSKIKYLAIEDFKNFIFKPKDEKILRLLLNNLGEYTSTTYNDLIKINGATDLITKIDFFINYNDKNLKDFSTKEIENNKDVIKSHLINKLLKRKYDVFNDLIRLDCDIEKFKSIFDYNFMDIMYKFNPNKLFTHMDRDTSIEKKEKSLYLRLLYVHYIVNEVSKNQVLVENVDIQNFFKELREINHLIFNDGFNKNLQNSLKSELENLENTIKLGFELLVAKTFENNNLEKIINNSSAIFVKEAEVGINLIQKKLNNPNALYFLFKEYIKDHRSGYNTVFRVDGEKVQESIDNCVDAIINTNNYTNKEEKESYINSCLLMLSFLEKEANKKNENGSSLELIKGVKKLFSFQQKLQFQGKKLINGLEFKKDNNNFISLGVNDLENMSDTIVLLATDIRSELINQWIQSGKLMPNALVYRLLSNSDDGNTRNLLKSYVKKHRDTIENNELKNLFMSNKYQKEILPMVSFEKENLLFIEIKDLLKRNEDISIYFNKIIKVDSYSNYSRSDLGLDNFDFSKINLDEIKSEIINTKDKNKIKELKATISDYIDFLNDEVNNKSNLLPFEFTEKIIKKELENKNYKEFKNLRELNVFKKHEGLFVDKINEMSYLELTELLKDEDASKFFFSNIDVIKLNNLNYSNEENINIANIVFKKKNEMDIKRGLNIFKNNQVFIKDYVAKKMPEKLIYSYALIPNLNENKTTVGFIKNPYTKEEIVNIYNDLKRKYKCHFPKFEVNDDIKFFIENNWNVLNLKDNKDSNKKKDYLNSYLNVLDFYKEKSAVLYNIFLFNDFAQSGLVWGKESRFSNDEDKSKDEVVHSFISKLMDIDVVLSGFDILVKEILVNDLSENESKPNMKAIAAVLRETYYIKQDSLSYNQNYCSDFDNIQTKKIIDFLWVNAPLFLIERYRIGSTNNIVNFLEENSSDLITIENVKNLIYPDKRMFPDNLKLENDYGKDDTESAKSLKKLMVVIINSAIENKNIEIIEYLAYELATYKFLEDNVDYSKRKNGDKDYKSDLIFDVLSKSKEFNDLLNMAVLKVNLDKNLIEKEVKVRAIKKI